MKNSKTESDAKSKQIEDETYKEGQFDANESLSKMSELIQIFNPLSSLIMIKIENVNISSIVFNNKFDQLQLQNDQFKKFVESNAKYIRKCMDYISKMIDSSNTYHEQHSKLLQLSQQLENDLKTVQSEVFQLQSSLEQSYNSYTDASNIINEVSRAIESTIKMKSPINDEITKLTTIQKGLQHDHDDTEEILKDTNKQLSITKNEKSNLDSELISKRSDLRSAKLGLTTDETSAKSIKQKLQQTISEIPNLRSRLDEITNIQNERIHLHEQFQSEILQTQQENENIEKEIEQFNKNLDECKAINEKYNKTINDLEENINRINSSHQKLELKYSNLTAKHNEFKHTHELKRTQMQAYIESIRNKAAELEADISLISSQISKLASEKEQTKEIPNRKSNIPRSRLFPSQF